MPFISYRVWVLVAILLFSAGVVCGLVPPVSITVLVSEDIATIKQFSDFLLSLPPAVTALLIYLKNVSAVVLSFIFSPILCLMPILALTVNGVLLGSILVMVSQEKSVGFVLAGLLPHGIFELPAFIIGEAAALSFGVMVMLALFKKETRKLLLPGLRQNLRYLVLAFVLLVPAAIIETFVTPLLLGG